MEILFYCPDENFKLRGDLLERIGIGGGKTALINLAKALSKKGNKVSVIGYVEEGIYDGVYYISKEKAKNFKADVLVVTTSSKFDLSELKEKNFQTRLKFLWVHAAGSIKGIEEYEWNGIVCVSHFVKNYFTKTTQIPVEKFFVIHNGLDTNLFKWYYRFTVKRNPYGIVFASHPIKGLDKVIYLIKELREKISPHFFLDVYGGYKLWGNDQPDLNITTEGVIYKGLLPQATLVERLFSYNFMINLYDIPEGFGLIYTQALKAGVICIVSNVGGISEIIKDGYNGFLISNPANSISALEEVKNLISYLVKDKKFVNYIRKNAMKYDRDWLDVATDFLTLFNSMSIRTKTNHSF
jgi:glycosyltransferase involved in cell wall biosynthesis